jgi:DNA mismatch endonuclease (patch repair protein)
MGDLLTPERRSWNMSQIRGRDTSPELVVRSMLHRMGFRFSLHRKDLPGKPDIVMRKHGTVIFVHGCFWHLHKGCKQARIPKTRSEWWREKLEGNAARDGLKKKELRRLGWRVLTVWECETEKPEKLRRRLERLLSGSEQIR